MGVYFFLYPFDGEPFIQPVEELEEVYFSTPLLTRPLPFQFLQNSTSSPSFQKKQRKKIVAKFPIPFNHYLSAFQKVIREIEKGNSYLLNLTFPSLIFTNYNLLEIYNSTPAPFKLYFKGKFVCFSPERFIKVEGNQIFTYPMKGTIDATIPDAENKILNNQKEMAEHIMVVDLLRNDLGIVGRKVRVTKFRYIDKIYAGRTPLLQVSSEITATLPTDWEKGWREWLPLLLPAGSISGTPKRKSVEIIRKVERYRRGYYTGIFGIVDEERKRLDSGVIIRYLERVEEWESFKKLDVGKLGIGELGIGKLETNKLESGKLEVSKLEIDKLGIEEASKKEWKESWKNVWIYKSGGGITIDSNPYSEWKELIRKIYL